MSENAPCGLADRDLAIWLAEHREGTARFDVIQARTQARARALARGRTPPVKRVTELEIQGPETTLAVRLYEPEDDVPHLVVYLHGGMWILGDLETHDRTCRRLAISTGARVLAVDFRLAPEHPWPAAVDDAEQAVEWARAELGAGVPLLAGDSSGGHLALLVALRLRDHDRRCGGLLLALPRTLIFV